MMSDVGKQLDTIATKFADLDTLRRKTKAENDLAIDLKNIEAQADQDTDVTRAPYYQQEIEKVSAKHLATVPDVAKAEVSENFRLRGYNAYSKIRSDFRQKEINTSIFEGFRKVESDKDMFISTVHLAEKEAAQKSSLAKIEELRVSGAITPTQAASKVEEITKGWWKDVAIFDASTNPNMYWENRETYAKNGIGPQDLVATDGIAEKTANKMNAQREREVKDIADKKYDDLITLTLENKLSVSDIVEEMNIPPEEGGVDRTKLLRLQKALLSKQVVTDANKVIRSEPKAREVFKNFSKVLREDIPTLQLREFLLDAVSDGNISTEEGAVLNKINGLINNVNYNKESNPIVKGWRRLLNNFSTYKYTDKPHSDALDDLREYLRAIGKDENPDEASGRIIKQRIDKNLPQFADWTEEGKTYPTLIGAVKYITRDEDGMPIVEMLNAPR